ncbi:MAG: MBOAT family protein [Desulfovibrio sp.]|jgi:D-alanyl-lipoteichoic acid acyltransferase DltB (MBOAT superfamily)|nr:MBOAT family protein [Desulfovibrio sp.]
MNFVTSQFALFFLVVLLSWQASQNRPGLRPGFLLAANLLFYAAAGAAFLPILLTAAFFTWGAARLMASPALGISRGAWRAAGIAANLCLLAFFKYYEFFLVELANTLALFGLALPMDALLPSGFLNLAFPLGISFYVFQSIAYLADQRAYPHPHSFPRVLLFLSFFPTLLSGPILRPQGFFPQMDAVAVTPLPATETDIQEGFALILSGLFKKVVLAGYLAEAVVRDAFQVPEHFSSWGALLAVYGYSLQIYCDFSGYTDLALGFGRLLGFRLPRNFNAPYLACNLREFWRRWHISLSTWLRDYLYIPLGGSRNGRLYRNLMLTMLLGGLWHGAHTRFLLWGAVHGAGLCLTHAAGALFRSRKAPEGAEKGFFPALRCFCAWCATFHFVSFAWVLFGAEDMDRALAIFRRILDWGQAGHGFPLMALPAIAAAFFSQAAGRQCLERFVRLQTRLPLAVRAASQALLAALILRMGPDGVLPFIYFQF